MIFGVWIGLALSKKDVTNQTLEDGKNCNTPIVTWLVVYACLRFLYVLKHLTMIILVNKFKAHAKRPSQQVEGLQCLFLLNFQVAWLIYGNTFHYTDVSISCKDHDSDYRSLWTLMMISLAFGYLVFLMYFFICCCGACLFCLAR